MAWLKEPHKFVFASMVFLQPLAVFKAQLDISLGLQVNTRNSLLQQNHCKTTATKLNKSSAVGLSQALLIGEEEVFYGSFATRQVRASKSNAVESQLHFTESHCTFVRLQSFIIIFSDIKLKIFKMNPSEMQKSKRFFYCFVI